MISAWPHEAQSQQPSPSDPATGSEAPAAGQAPAPEGFAMNVTVIETAPLSGAELPVDAVPAPVQRATSDEIEASGAVDLSDFLNRRMNGVHVNENQGNPFQPDINYRGYTASP